jgi:hypothetical protein
LAQADPYDIRAASQDDPEETIRQLKELGARKWPTASEAQQFARAFSDPANAELAVPTNTAAREKRALRPSLQSCNHHRRIVDCMRRELGEFIQ